ncbi:MAG TPA: hypothetical protein VLZ33_08205 [Dysgonamonadaceae bacterium]|nr:hypothetical protein [Dysgonamonadaceae bacterium]
MKEFAKYTGVLVMIIGVLILVIPFLQGSTTNTNLLIGLLIIIEGFLGHIFVNNLKDTKRGNIMWMIALLVIPYFIFQFAKKTAYGDQLDKQKS